MSHLDDSNNLLPGLSASAFAHCGLFPTKQIRGFLECQSEHFQCLPISHRVKDKSSLQPRFWPLPLPGILLPDTSGLIPSPPSSFHSNIIFLIPWQPLKICDLLPPYSIPALLPCSIFSHGTLHLLTYNLFIIFIVNWLSPHKVRNFWSTPSIYNSIWHAISAQWRFVK